MENSPSCSWQLRACNCAKTGRKEERISENRRQARQALCFAHLCRIDCGDDGVDQLRVALGNLQAAECGTCEREERGHIVLAARLQKCVRNEMQKREEKR